MRSTFNNPFVYWAAGSVLIWLIAPFSLADILIAPTWHAPNWQCDSLGIPIMETQIVLLPWAVIAVLISGAAALLTRGRQAGVDILDLRLGTPPRRWIVTPIAVALVAYFGFNVCRHIWQAVVPQTIASDCAGRAEMVEVIMRGPLVQLSPFLNFATAIWVLHIRALLLSPRLR